MAGVLSNIGLAQWNPYVLVIWSKDASNTKAIEELKQYLEKGLDAHFLPCAFMVLDKNTYGITDGKPTEVQQEEMWRQLVLKVSESRGMRLMLQWEGELQKAAGRMLCNLIQSARENSETSTIGIDEAVDSLMTSIGQAATSTEFAKNFPRNSATVGLLPLLSDEMHHQILDDAETEFWVSGMSKATSAQDPILSETQRAFLNTAFNIALDESAKTYIERGSVFSFSSDNAKDHLGLDQEILINTFDIASGLWPKNAKLKLIQLEGACDSAQRKPGVVPLVLAVELDAGEKIKPKGKGRKESVECTPSFILEKTDLRKLVVNVRFFLTKNRADLDKLKPDYRLREPLVALLAFAWANHSIRPGIMQL